VVRRAAELLHFICARPESEIAVVTHSSFLMTLFNAAVTAEDPKHCKWLGHLFALL
jgi:hypothetical protein